MTFLVVVITGVSKAKVPATEPALIDMSVMSETAGSLIPKIKSNASGKTATFLTVLTVGVNRLESEATVTVLIVAFLIADTVGV